MKFELNDIVTLLNTYGDNPSQIPRDYKGFEKSFVGENFRIKDATNDKGINYYSLYNSKHRLELVEERHLVKVEHPNKHSIS